MITAYFVGDQQLLERIQALPEVVNSGLIRGITQLGIDLQRSVQRDARRDYASRRSARDPSSSADLHVEQSGATITASISFDPRDVVRRGGVAGPTPARASPGLNRNAFSE